MVKKKNFEWESQKSRNLMEILARDNGKFLYKELPKIVRYYCRADQREDLTHEFFLDITGRADSYDYDIDSSKSIHEDLNLKGWIISAYYNFRSRFYQREKCRIHRKKGKPRAQEFNIDRITNGELRLVNPSCYQLRDNWYRICMGETEQPWQGLGIDSEVDNEIKKQEVAEVIQNAMSQLKDKYRRLIRLYYFEGLSTKEIGRRLEISYSNVTSQMFLARRDLMKVLPYSVVDRRGWIGEAA